jgi:hypothetical protein
MSGNEGRTENDLLRSAVDWLRERLPAAWEVEVGGGRERFPTDAAIEIRAPNVHSTLAVEARRSFGPRDVERLLGGLVRTLRQLAPYVSVLVVAPWLSPRTRELLTAEGVNYLDLSGNALVRLDNPALYLETRGAARDPQPASRGKPRVRGPKAGRLIRFLIDVRPPYGVTDTAAATQLAPGYVSRLLDALDDDALVERTRRGRVDSVDVGALIRRWAESYDVFSTNNARTFLARGGGGRALPSLADIRNGGRVAVTGSFAAVRLAPVAAPALLCAYVEDVDAVATRLDLIPADEGGNVALLRAFDAVVWERHTEHDGVVHVAPSQVAIDCLTGNGRMPAEGAAVLEWMLANEDAWRLESLDALRRSSVPS